MTCQCNGLLGDLLVYDVVCLGEREKNGKAFKKSVKVQIINAIRIYCMS